MVKYPVAAARALAFLKRFYNDVDIYVEDTTCHNMVLFVCVAILGQNVRLESLNQLGGRDEVLKACRLDQKDDGRKKLYIIDGDLDLIAGMKKPALKNLYRLRAYCIENLILAENAILELMVQNRGNLKRQDAAAMLTYQQWLDDAKAALLPLFVLYGVARRLAPGVATVSYPIERLYVASVNGPQLSPPKIRARMRGLLRDIRPHAALTAVRTLRKRLWREAVRYRPSSDFLVSGKGYLFPLLRVRLGQLVAFRGTNEELRTRLARHYDPRRESFFARRLRAIAHV